MSRLNSSCPDLGPDLASRSDPDWQTAVATISHGVAGSRPLPRARLSTHSVRSQLTVGRSRSRSNRRTPARALALDALAIAPALATQARARTLGCSDRTWHDRNRLGAGDSAASLLRAGGSAFAPYRRARPAIIGGGVIVGAARRSPTAAISDRLEVI